MSAPRTTICGAAPSVCVYCGSRFGADPAYRAAAEALGRGLASRRMRLVYGAGDVRLMGAVARAAQHAGGEIFGVIPAHLLAREVGKRDLGQFVVTETMHEHKKVMFMNADAVIALPGGAGALDELFEVLAWRQLGLHAKPIFLTDVNGFWAPLTALMAHMQAQGFVDAPTVDALTLCDGADATLDAIAAALA
jgi:uncharacterized protein (TIGR00730 family)